MSRQNYSNPVWKSDLPLWEKEPDQEGVHRVSLLLNTAPEQAIIELQALAEKGSVFSMVLLGHAFRNGIGTKVNLQKFEEWYCRASDGGSAMAAGTLGDYYCDTKDYYKAEKYFKVSAERNYLPGIFRLGRLYLDGVGVDKQLRKARDHLEEASARGHVVAKRVLGGLLVQGKFGLSEQIRGVWLLLVAFKEYITVTIADPESDRLRG